MAVVVAHEPSSLYLGEGFTLVDRAAAIEFDSAQAAQSLLDRYASEPSFVTESLVPACSAA
jgi:hypothetical protein